MADQEYYAEDTFGGVQATGRVYTGAQMHATFEVCVLRAATGPAVWAAVVSTSSSCRTTMANAQFAGNTAPWLRRRQLLLLLPASFAAPFPPLHPTNNTHQTITHMPTHTSGPFLGISFMSLIGCFLMSTVVKVSRTGDACIPAPAWGPRV
jgi:hypothetical protein